MVETPRLRSPLSTSPYFDKRRRTGHTTHSVSGYFVESPSSAWGSVKSLQSLLFRLTNATEPRCQRLSRSRPHEHSSLCCSTCESVIVEAIKHFRSCSIFNENLKKQWSELSPCGDGEECWKRAERHLDCSVRHLCPERCYMRAFAPCRDWLSLRNSIHELTDCSTESLLAGWRCMLVSDADSHLPRTVFITPDGKVRRSLYLRITCSLWREITDSSFPHSFRVPVVLDPIPSTRSCWALAGTNRSSE
jgi:hypothetical protein